MGVLHCKLVCALLMMLCMPVPGQSYIVFFSGDDLLALQRLWAAWNQSTPDLSTNLAGWHATTGNLSDVPCYSQKTSWRGVSCLRFTSNATSGDQYTWVIGLTLSDSSIHGTLPPGIQNFQYLVTLTLTGNPNLSGPLPKELGGLPLNLLDLHDNSFNGTIPTELSSLVNLLQLDLSGNQLSGQFPDQFASTGTLQDYSIARNQFWGVIPPQVFENLTQLLTLDISDNDFKGPVPNLTMMHSLNKLNLSNNGFTGIVLSELLNGVTLPKTVIVLDLSNLTISGDQSDWSFLQRNQSQIQELFLDNNYINGTLDITSLSRMNLIAQKSKGGNSSGLLQKLSLKNNKITNLLSSAELITDVTTIFYLEGNPYCYYSANLEDDTRRCYCKQICLILPITDVRGSHKLKVILIATISSGTFLIIVLLISIVFLYQSKQNLRYLMKKFDEAEVNPKRFDYTELRVATKNFHEDRKLGAGGFGAVYKGIFPNKSVVAVKQLFLKTQDAVDSFINEVILITKLQHRNLVNLKGFCVNGKEMLLIYEYVDNSDLDKILLSSTERNPWKVINWAARLKICVGVAHGLYYLHASSLPKIIHRDIKASNILLDKEFNPKIGDFGLARPFREEKSQITTEHRAGTIGYLAPEYMLWGQLSEKADVYSFGVLLLEIVSGKRNRDPTMSEDEVYLPNRAWNLHKQDQILSLVDENLHLSASEVVEAKRVLDVALMCIQSSVEKRPTMFSVVSMLSREADVISISPEESGALLDYRAQLESLEHDGSGSSQYFNNNSNNNMTESSDLTSSSNRQPGFGNRNTSIATIQLSKFGGR